MEKMVISTFKELYDACDKFDSHIYELVQMREADLAELQIPEIRIKVKKSLEAMKEAIKAGLVSNEMSISGMCGDDCEKLQKRFKSTPSLFGKLYEKIITYAIATSEENLRMGKIVACPTAGSCGIVPSVIIAVSEEFAINEKIQIDALITAKAAACIICFTEPPRI